MKNYNSKYVSSSRKEIGYISSIFRTKNDDNVPAQFLHFLRLMIEENKGKVLRKDLYGILKRIGYKKIKRPR